MVVKKQEEVVEDSTEPKETKAAEKRIRKCFFCSQGIEPNYTDSQTLRRFLSDRSRIIPKIRTGVCSKHQRAVTRNIKYARHLALLPFVTRV